MKILAIETSCDETAIAIADFTPPFLQKKAGQAGSKKKPSIKILSNIVSSQTKIHEKFGGVVPNLAKREHQKNLPLTLLQVLKEGRFSISKSKFLISKQIPKSKIQKIEKILEREPELLIRFKKFVLPLKPPPIDAIAVTYGPGLAPALWVGVNFAKALAYIWNKPLIPINHMAGHLYSAFLQKEGIADIKFPALALLVSGGHTELVLARGHDKYKITGETLDDAAGEAFDKVARILGLKYPGGPGISRLAEKGNPNKYKLPSPMIGSKDYNFSFSGLKTAVLYFVRDHKNFSKANLAASFQKAAVEVLVSKTMRAAKQYKVKTILLGGGVAANKLLREKLVEKIKKELPKTDYRLSMPNMTGDNALMIALAAYFTGKKKAWNKVQADANLRL